jgi:SAM-dependent methyltransferase
METMPNSTWPAWVSPECGEELREERGALVGAKGPRYPIVNGIPRFVPETSYADAFGAQWNHYRTTQLDSCTGVPISSDRLKRGFGEELWESLKDKHILEAGCGAGRFTEVLLQRGARVTSIDLSSAVEANARNFPICAQHRVAQANIVHMPFAQGQYEVVFCMGVIQHTPDPDETIRALATQVKPNGWLVFDHYKYSLSSFTKLAEPIFRAWLKRMPTQKGIEWTERLVTVFLPLHKAVRHSHPAQALLSRISPVRCYYHGIPELNDQQQREWAMLDTHDALTSWYRHKRTSKQIVNLLESLRFVEIQCGLGTNGLVVRARRPATD